MRRVVRTCVAAWALAVAVPLLVQADDSPEPDANKPIVELVSQLDHDRYSYRESAAEALFQRGEEAVEALERAALEGSLETTHQALQVLERLYRQGNAEAQKAAAAALRRLAESKHAPAARRARLVVGGQPGIHTRQRNAQMQRVLRIVPGGIQVQINPPPGGRQRVVITKKKGQLEIRHTKPGEDLRLTEDNNGIKLQITKTQNGKKQSKTYQAKTAEELKKKHPEAYKIYQKLKALEKGQNVRRVLGKLPAVPVPGVPRILPVPLPQRVVPQKAVPQRAVPQKAKPQKAVPAVPPRVQPRKAP